MSTEMYQGMFHITIGAAPVSQISLDNDLRMVKAALLYADRAKLCSVTSSMILSILALGEFTPKQQIEFLESLVPLLVNDPAQAASLLTGFGHYRRLRCKKHLHRDELLFRLKLEAVLEKQWKDVKQTVIKLAEDAGAEGIVRAAQSGMLEFHIFESFEDTDGVVREFVDVVCQAVSDGSTYPLFDDQTGKIVNAGIQEGKIRVSEAGVVRGKHTGLAAYLLERLPLFDLASVEEILDARRELERPLIRFRGAMIRFSETVKNAAWDEDFSSEAEQIFYRDVQPAILDIEDAVRSNRYLASLTRKFVEKPLVIPSGSALALVVSQLSSLPDIASQALAVGIGSGTVAYDAYKDWREKQQAIEQNQLYFYYRAGKRLSELR